MKCIALIVLIAAAWYSAAAASNVFSPGPTDPRSDTLLSLLPTSPLREEWVQTETPHVYDTKNLHEFIDGGADLFFEYGFRRVAVAEYQKNGTGSISLEIYEMQDAAAAFGIYSVRSGLEAKRIAIGQEGSVHPYYIMFWDDRFYASITGSDSTAELVRGLETIARMIDRKISHADQKPPVARLLLSSGVQKERYFRGRLGFASARIVDITEMFPVADGAIGTYSDHIVAVLRYRSALEARERFGAIAGRLKTDERFSGYTEDNQMVSAADQRNQVLCAEQCGSHIVLALSSDASIARSSLTAIVDGVMTVPQTAEHAPSSMILGLDHIPLAVSNLEAAAKDYRQLGFTLKQGRPHENGIRNQHIKFRDGTEIELITAHAVRDSLTSAYVSHLAKGDGPAFVSFFTPEMDRVARHFDAEGRSYRRSDGLITLPESDKLRYMFFAQRRRSPTDRPEHFKHANGVESLAGVWIAGDGLAAERTLLAGLGITTTDEEVRAPEAVVGSVARLQRGEVLFLPASCRLVPGRPIVGATLLVQDLRLIQRVLRNGHHTLPAVVRVKHGSSIFLPPAITHGIWLEFRQEQHNNR